MDTELAERRGGVDARLEDVEETQAEHAERLSELERTMQQIIGAAKTLSVIAGTSLVGVVANFVGVL